MGKKSRKKQSMYEVEQKTFTKISNLSIWDGTFLERNENRGIRCDLWEFPQQCTPAASSSKDSIDWMLPPIYLQFGMMRKLSGLNPRFQVVSRRDRRC